MLTFPAVYQLLPSYPNCCGWEKDGTEQIGGYFDSTDEKAWAKFAWVPDQFKTEQGRQALGDMLHETSHLQELMKQPIPEEVRSFNIVTGLIDTQWKTFFGSQSGAFVGTKNYPGDGTVIEWSAANGAPSEARPATGNTARSLMATRRVRRSSGSWEQTPSLKRGCQRIGGPCCGTPRAMTSN